MFLILLFEENVTKKERNLFKFNSIIVFLSDIENVHYLY